VASSARPKLQRHPGTLPPADRSRSIRPPAEGSVAEPASTVPVTRTASVLASVRTLGSAVAWLSGSLAGIGAIFYAFGYLITLANLDLLGVDLLVFRYDPTTYIHRGSDFLLLSVIIVAKAWGPAFVVAVLGFLGSQMPRVRKARLWATQPFFCRIGEHPDLLKAAAYLAILALFARELLWAHSAFQEDMAASGVLYPTAGSGAAESRVREWIVTGKQGQLYDHYAAFVAQQAVIGALLLAAWGLTRAWRWRVLLTAPFALGSALALAWLPLEYGKLVLSNKFSQVLVRFEQSTVATSQPPATMYLLNRTDTDFVLWAADQRKIVWIPARTVTSAELSASRSLSEIIQSSGGAGR
jgi:hypothetical protein